MALKIHQGRKRKVIDINEPFPEARHFFFTSSNFKAEESMVAIPFENENGSKTNVNLPRGTDVKIWNMVVPYQSQEKPKVYSNDVINYSAKVREADSSYMGRDQSRSIYFDVAIDVELYSIASDRESKGSTLLSVHLKEHFKFDKEVAKNYFYPVWHLQSDNSTWVQKDIFDLRNLVADGFCQFLLDNKNNGNNKKGSKSSRINFTSTKKRDGTIIKFHLNTELCPWSLGEKIAPIFDIFCPELGDSLEWYKKFRHLNMFEAFWPTNEFDKNAINTPIIGLKAVDDHAEFFRLYLDYVKPSCLVSSMDRSSTDNTFIFHFKEYSINVKAGIFYVTKEAFTMMKKSVFFMESVEENRINWMEQPLEEIIKQMENKESKDEKQKTLSFLKQNDEKRKSLIKVIVKKSFVFYHMGGTMSQRSTHVVE